MEKVSNRVARLSESQTLAMAQLSRELKAKGIDVINLSIGEPDFNTPDHIKVAGKKAIDDNYSFYSPVPGFDDLRKAISEKFKRENNLDYATDQIVVSNGAKQSISNVMLCLVNEGDEVIVPAPYWVSYVEIVKMADGTNVIIDSKVENDFKITPEQLENAITDKTKVFIFSSPSNPTGSLYTRSELQAFAEIFRKHENIFIISDEIYEHINFTGKHESIAQFDFIKDRVIVVNGVSKGYAMTGWRIGYIGAAKWIAKASCKLQGQYSSGASSIAQKASVAALNTDDCCVKQMCEVFKRRRDLIVNLLSSIKGLVSNVPQGAFYVFPDISNFYGKSSGVFKINNSDDMCMYLLNDAHVAVVGGDAFGSPECIRLSYATSDANIVEAIKRIKTALEKLN
jgi:aspartate aminotransferase